MAEPNSTTSGTAQESTTPQSGTTSATAAGSNTTSDTTQPSSTTSDTTEGSNTTSDTTQPSSTTSDTTQPSSTTSDTTQPSSTTPDCNNNCGSLAVCHCAECKADVCSTCFEEDHNGHKYINDLSETAKEKASKLLNSVKFIKEKMENLKKTRAAYLETKKTLKRFGEDACRRISEETERFIVDLKEKSETVQTETKKDMDQTELDLTKAMEKIDEIKPDLETHLTSITENDCLQLDLLPRIEELKQQCETMPDHTSEEYQYKDWREKDANMDIMKHLGSVVTKSCYLNKSNQFRFNINVITQNKTVYISENKFTSNDVKWSCIARIKDGILCIGIRALKDDNPVLNHIFIDEDISLLNIVDHSKTISINKDNKRYVRSKGGAQGLLKECYISEDGQFDVQFDIIKVRNK